MGGWPRSNGRFSPPRACRVRRAQDAWLTQSAVSQQIAALERQLGLRLLHRGRGGVRPAPPLGHPHARPRAVPLARLANDSWTAPSRDGLIARACRAAGFQPRLTVLTSAPWRSAPSSVPAWPSR
jgi:DNA-binding transcriptional LysR family regulator